VVTPAPYFPRAPRSVATARAEQAKGTSADSWSPFGEPVRIQPDSRTLERPVFHSGLYSPGFGEDGVA